VPRDDPTSTQWRASRPRPTVSKWLLAALGAAALALPLSQVLRSQGAELARLAETRAQLDPLAQATHLQWGLLAHERVAARVLQGRPQLEAERRLQAAVVARRIAELRGTLLVGWWAMAERESQALEQDWQQLDTRIGLRRIDAAASGLAHRLLTEQALQIMDLVSAKAPTVLPGWAADGPRGYSAGPAAWAARAVALDRQLADLGRQQQVLHEQRSSTITALAGAGLLAGLLALAAHRERRRHPNPPAGSDAAASRGPRERRGHGRRASDQGPAPRPAQLAADELRALRDSFDTESPPRL
jgi:hypothetical protein